MEIRNFSIIAHIDHGKSTLADRMLEITHTIEARKMRDQVLDSMELERERGITIKMQPVRMNYEYRIKNNDGSQNSKQNFILNLIDTPGHIDFSYEVSRAMRAVEGSVLLVDATQGVQAQTLSVLQMAKDAGLTIIPAISKIDSHLAQIEDTEREIIEILGCEKEDIIKVSGKTGEGVEKLLRTIIEKIPPPKTSDTQNFKSLVFDFKYDNHRGVIVFVRVMSGSVKRGDKISFKATKTQFGALEVGTFSPEETPRDKIGEGEIGYVVTGLKEPGKARVGDTLSEIKDKSEPLAGYAEPKPVVWASIYPESQDDLTLLRQALDRLRLSDSSLTFEEEASTIMGKGYRCGFLGMLHMEIATERLKREFNLSLIVTTPSISYDFTLKKGKKIRVYSPSNFPEDFEIEKVEEPWVTTHIITPERFTPAIFELLYDHEAHLEDSHPVAGLKNEPRTQMIVTMPLRELMRNFFDSLKSKTSGFASLSYEIGEMREAPVTKMEILIADEPVPAFARVISEKDAGFEAEKTVDKLKEILPRQLFVMKIQAKVHGRIIASRSVSALKKDVTGYLYGGDRTRKMKLWEKQKRGKEKLKDRGVVNIPQEVFVKMMRSE